MLAAQNSACIIPGVNLRNPLHTGHQRRVQGKPTLDQIFFYFLAFPFWKIIGEIVEKTKIVSEGFTLNLKFAVDVTGSPKHG